MTEEQLKTYRAQQAHNEAVGLRLGWTRCTCNDPECGVWFSPNAHADEPSLGLPDFKLKVVFSDEDVPWQIIAGVDRSIFLAGPTPRKAEHGSWRPQALQILSDLGYPGWVLIPERKNWKDGFDYVDQVHWERDALEGCETILFWVPRVMAGMPALTTNVEFGYWMSKRPTKVVYGRPDEAENCRYLDWLYKVERGQKPENTLKELINRAYQPDEE